MWKHFCAFIVLAFASRTSTFSQGQTQPPVGMLDLDFERYAGTWYAIEFGDKAGSNSTFASCIQESYAKNSANPFFADVHWKGGVPGSSFEVNGFIIPENKNFSNPWVFLIDGERFEATVLATDYLTWTADYTRSNVAGTQFERIAIRSRTRTLDTVVRKTIHSFVESMGLKGYEFGFVDHSQC